MLNAEIIKDTSLFGIQHSLFIIQK